MAGLIHEISANCNAYSIDPKADQQQLPPQFQKIVMIATQGMQYLKKILRQSR
ncbi:hypothetical protein [Acinetobacter sp. SA01]|uniref:hypothetical protein n=1 Tax=Acinetobacter sp. SA01 TaxID=1862567 RepID=UPI00140D7E7B|nr:hypothetical protein [Acinetobacter sp. SA01]